MVSWLGLGLAARCQPLAGPLRQGDEAMWMVRRLQIWGVKAPGGAKALPQPFPKAILGKILRAKTLMPKAETASDRKSNSAR